MNLQCLTCRQPFTELDWVKCDGCERISHREPCGVYRLVERDGEDHVYFFCMDCENECPDLEPGWWGI